MFKSEGIRNLNTIRLYQENVDTPVFTAYTSQGWHYSFNIKVSDPLEATKSLIKGSFASAVFSQETGYSTVLDMPRKLAFQGSDPLRFTIKCFLLAEDGPEKITDAINSLAKLVLPKRFLNTSMAVDKVKETLTENGWDATAKLLDKFQKAIGTIHTLETPEQFKRSSDNEYRGLTLQWGGSSERLAKITSNEMFGRIIEGVLIKDVSVDTPMFYYEDNGIPIPSRVDITLSLETLRILTLDRETSKITF